MEKSCYKDFIIQKELGRGSFGVVYLVHQRVTKQCYVLKRINIGHIHAKYQQAALREVEILKKISHPNIIKYHFSFIEDNTLNIITEYAEGGDLYQLLQKHRSRRTLVPESELWRIFHEMTSALSYLHMNNIIHRDVKCQNVFLTKNLTVKLGDLGASKLMTAEMQATRVGTPLYLAPEMVKQQPYDHKIDIWGLGCILYTLAAKESPFVGANLITLGISIINKNPKNIPGYYSPRLNEVIMNLLQKDPENRPDSKGLSKFFKEKEEPKPGPRPFNSDEELFIKKFPKVPKPHALEPVLPQNLPSKPYIPKDMVRVLRMNSSEASSSKYSTFADSRARMSCNMFRKDSILEDFQAVKEEKDLMKEENLPVRPETAFPGKAFSNKRPVTARPSLRTIIKSNTTVKINNFIPPARGSKLKITVNDLMNYKNTNEM
jgi:NIMA (never in mitosis gene a)-related kinase